MRQGGWVSMTLHRKQSGFTIVELLIVIVVIGILAALVITTFSGVQRRARNTERETDIKSIHGHLETFHADNGYYPGLTDQIDDDTWVQTNLKGLDVDALRAPKETANTMVGTGGDTDNYVYAATGCTGTAPAQECTGYTLTANLEGGGSSVQEALN
jgi:prepilin-type N-terminal cleavage/methylation domain-containing protein